MLLDVSREVTTSGLGAGHQFKTTENSSKLFAMLSNMLYKDKERSVLTELSSNAVDAHKLVGKGSEPIVVSLPTQLVPEVRIRDFGPGLSEEQVYQFLTTYGESSKQGSNDFIGGFGIGSKSPASVTDTWTIHSYNQGVHKQYLIFVSADGIPSLTKITEKPTTETGLEVIVPAKKDRIHAWFEAAKKAYLTYEVQPTIKNAGFKLQKITWVYDSDSLAVSSTHDVIMLGPTALINGRLYPLDTGKIEGLNIFNSALLKIGGVFKFNIGELSLNLSREDLQYDEKTIKAIKTKVEKAGVELAQKWKVEVADKATDQYDYYQMGCAELTKWFDDCNYSSSYAPTIYDSLGKNCKFYTPEFRFNSKNITIKLDKEYTFKSLQSGSDKVTSKTYRWNSFFHYSEDGGWNGRPKSYSLTLNLPGIKEIVFIENDGATLINMRVKEKYLGTKTNVLICDDFKFLPKFLQSQIVKGTSLPKPTITKAKRAPQAKSEYYRIVGSQFRKELDTYFTAAKSVAYVKFKSANSTTSIDDDFLPYVKMCQKYGIEVVGIKEGTSVPTWAKHPKDLLKDVFDTKVKNYDELCKWIMVFTNKPMIEYYGKRTPIAKSKNPSKWNELIDLLSNTTIKNSDQYVKYEELSNLQSLAKIFNITLPPNKYELMLSEFWKAYPMLELIQGYGGSGTLTRYGNDIKIVEYVELVGK